MKTDRILLQRCKKCLIAEDRSIGILIGEDGICNLCKKDPNKYKLMSWEDKQLRFEELIYAEKGKHPYDGLVMMSGGKDSAYLALQLTQRYGLNLMAISIDNGYEYPDTFDNVKHVCDRLGIPLIIYQPNLGRLKEFYRYVMVDEKLKRDDFGQICFYCGIYLKRIASDFAKRFNVPYIFSGYNPDQVAELGESEVIQIDNDLLMHQRFLRNAVDEKIREAEAYTRRINKPDMARYFIPPETKLIYYYQHFPYNPLEMIDVIKSELEWRPIKRFRENYIASGCQLACVLLYFCDLKNKPDYIQKEFSAQIRRGTLDRDYVRMMYDEFEHDENEIDEVLNTLNLDRETMLHI